eukprot:TRINITY_DN80363_c0_g1_i1.p1 TRINITY_DN80363_c0_g1~~TRINITY_DN80363_c0_g1_i1.p1  ORF type:complete len:501 (+),score=56.17 TRINITY_DN80363_c0_g1_i1:22-1503(+)
MASEGRPLLSHAETIQHTPQNRHALVRLLLCGAAATLAGLTNGFTIGNMSSVLDNTNPNSLVADANLGDGATQALGGMMQIGALLGSGLSFLVCDRWGRRPTIAVAAVLLTAGAFVAALGPVWCAFVGRTLSGLGQGTACHSVPMYTSELAPTHLRAPLDAAFQLFTTTGILAAYSLNYLIQTKGWTISGFEIWRLSLAMPVPAGACFFLCVLLLLPESPRWLWSVQRHEQAEEVLRRLRHAHEVQGELQEIEKSSLEEREGTGKGSAGSWADVFGLSNRWPVLVGVVVCTLQVLTGIDIFTTYAPGTFSKCGFSDDTLFATMLIGVVFVIVTVVATLVVEHAGRRAFLLFGSVTMTISFGTLALALHMTNGKRDVWGYVGLISVLSIAGCFSLSWGPVAWIVPSEVFPQAIRAKAMSLAVCANWIADYIVVATWLSLSGWLGLTGGYIVYVAVGIAGGLFVWFYVPETRGLTLEQAAALLSGTTKRNNNNEP